MSAHKHTPGPWTADPDNFRIIGSDGHSIFAFRRLFAEHRANACLASAAPELLEACMAMLEWDDREKDHAVDFYARMDLCRAAFDKARAAIAKATGEPA